MNTAVRVTIVAGAAFVLWLALDLVLLVFAAILLAVFLRTIARYVAEHLKLSTGWALALVVVGLLGVLVGAGVLYARPLAEQVDQLTQTLPKAFAELTGWLRQYTWGRWLLDQIGGEQPSGEQVVDHATRVAGTLMQAAIAAAFIVFGGLYLAANPATYLRGLLRLIPPSHRRRAAELLFALGHTVRWWLVGQALAMALVGVTMGVGLAVIGVPLAFALGLVAGLLEFVPLVGPVLGLGPALLLAAAESTRQALYVLVLYGLVQTAESYLITPLVQRKVVDLPPVLTITAQIALSWVAGAMGLLLAVPIAAAALVTTQMLYLQDGLRDEVRIDAEESSRQELASASYLHDLVPPAATNAR